LDLAARVNDYRRRAVLPVLDKMMHSDTAVTLEIFAAYGVDATLKRLIGIFV